MRLMSTQRRMAAVTLAAAAIGTAGLAGCGSEPTLETTSQSAEEAGGSSTEAAAAPTETASTVTAPAQTPSAEDVAPPAEELAPAPPAEEEPAPIEEEAPPAPEPEPADIPDELDFTARVLGGEEFDGASLAGQDAVVYFWEPWCPVCHREAPDVADVAADFAGEVEFITVAGPSSTDGPRRDFVSDVGFGDFTNLVDDSGAVWRGFGVTYQYTAAFINDDGSVDVVTGPFDRDEMADRFSDLARS